jgi:hypothetical protein
MNEPRTPLSEEVAEQEARRLIHDAYQPTSFRDTTPTPRYGNAAPIAQPGRPPMSQKAVDVSSIMLAGSVASVPFGGITCLVLYMLDQVNPVSLTVGASAPVAFVLAISVLLRRAKGVLPDEHHHHYTGPVYQDQRNVKNKNTGVWVKNTNEQ